MDKASCLECGSVFTFRETNSAGKYCSLPCAYRNRARMSSWAGLSWRKLVMRISSHYDTSAVRVWNIIRTASDEARYVVVRDMLQERELLVAEIQRVYAAMTDAEREACRTEMSRLEKLRRHSDDVATHIERVRIICPQCHADCNERAATCYKCGYVYDTVGGIIHGNLPSRM